MIDYSKLTAIADAALEGKKFDKKPSKVSDAKGKSVPSRKPHITDAKGKPAPKGKPHIADAKGKPAPKGTPHITKDQISDALNKRAKARMYEGFKVTDSFINAKKKIKDALEDTETTNDAVNVAIEALNEVPAEQAIAAVIEVLAEAIDILETNGCADGCCDGACEEGASDTIEGAEPAEVAEPEEDDKVEDSAKRIKDDSELGMIEELAEDYFEQYHDTDAHEHWTDAHKTVDILNEVADIFNIDDAREIINELVNDSIEAEASNALDIIAMLLDFGHYRLMDIMGICKYLAKDAFTEVYPMYKDPKVIDSAPSDAEVDALLKALNADGANVTKEQLMKAYASFKKDAKVEDSVNVTVTNESGETVTVDADSSGNSTVGADVPVEPAMPGMEEPMGPEEPMGEEPAAIEGEEPMPSELPELEGEGEENVEA